MNLLKINTDLSKRTYGLDVFRAVAILLVVLSHGGFIIDLALPGFPYIRLIDGVELFFVLSGFLIGTILIKIYERSEKLQFTDLLSFWKRRWFRTLPNYYLILIVNVWLVSSGIIKGNIDNFNWKFLFFLQNFNTYFTDFFWESWSLTVEEWFYIFTPVTILVIHLLTAKFLKKQWVLLIVIGFFILFPLLYRISLSGEEVDYFWYDVKFRKVVLARLDAIMFGVLFAWIRFYLPKIWKPISIPLLVAGVALMYAVMHFARLDPVGFHAKTFYFSAIGLGAAMLLPFADNMKQNQTKVGKAITHISLISYSMYLINLSVVAQVIEVNFMPQNKIDSVVTYILYWTVVVVLSTLLYKYFEKPVMDLRDRTTKKTRI